VVAGVLAMSSASVFIRLARAEGAPPLIIAAYRLLIATLALSIVAVSQRVWHEYSQLGRRELYILCLSGLCLALHFMAWITSLDHTSVISSVVLVTTTPVWIALAAPLFLREKTSRSTWLGIAVAVAGGIVVGLADWHGSRSLTPWGDALALMGAIFWAAYLMIGRHIRAKLRFVAYVWLVYGIAAIFLTAWALVSGLRFTGYTQSAMLYMLALGLIPQLIGHSAANYALRHLPASLVGVITLGEPVGSTLLAIALLGEWPGLLQVAGGAVLLTGIGIALSADQPPSTSPTSLGRSRALN